MHGFEESFSGKVGVASWTLGGAASPAILGRNGLFCEGQILFSRLLEYQGGRKGGGEEASTVTGSRNTLRLARCLLLFAAQRAFQGQKGIFWGLV